MSQQTNLENLLSAERFDDARGLLQEQLKSGVMLDPRSDRHWTWYADRIAGAIAQASNLDATIPFWESLRDFFVQIIEPAWGHAHKGHIFFRLGIVRAHRNVTLALDALEAALAEDRILETSKGGTSQQIEDRLVGYSAYVALTLLERVQDSDLANKEEFVHPLFGPAFDDAITGAGVEPQQVRSAFGQLAPPAAVPMCFDRYEELLRVSGLRLPFATVALTGTVLECVLLSDLHFRKGLSVTTATGKDLRRVELGALMAEAQTHNIFPHDAIRVVCTLVNLLRNRLHPGNELTQTYKLAPRTAAVVKGMLERTLLDWAALM